MSGLFFNDKVSKVIDTIPAFNSTNDLVSVDSKFKKVIRNVMCILTTMKETFIYRNNIGTSAMAMEFELLIDSTINNLKMELEYELKRSISGNLKELKITKNTKHKNMLDVLIVLSIENKKDLHLLVNMQPKGIISLESAIEKVVNYVIS